METIASVPSLRAFVILILCLMSLDLSIPLYLLKIHFILPSIYT